MVKAMRFMRWNCVSVILLGLLMGCDQKLSEKDTNLIDYIVECRATQTLIVPPTATTHPDLSVEKAYALLEVIYQRESATLGTPSGYKLAYASKASQKANGISEPVYGRLHSKQEIPDHGTLDLSAYADCCNESEITLKFGKTVDKRLSSVEELKSYVESVHIGLDINHFRLDTTAGKLKPADVIMSGVGIQNYMVGPGQDPSIDIDNLDLDLKHNGKTVYAGNSSAVMGSPSVATLWLAQKLYDDGKAIHAGDYILTGALSKSYRNAADQSALKGNYTANCKGLESLHLKIK